MRIEFVREVRRVMGEDATSLFITGDLGYNALEDLAKESGKRFLNAGVAEQNMVGVAAGIAISGFKPWVYSIAPFVTYRCLEQIRNDVCLHNLPVRLVGNGGGYTYGIMGSTHHALEDIGALKTLPNIQVFFPCSNNHVPAAVGAMHAYAGPSYLRLAISGYQRDDAPLRENARTLTRTYRTTDAARGVTVIAAGHAAQIALTMLDAAGAANDLDIDLFGVSRLPFDPAADEEIVASVRRTKRVVVLEEHYAAGGVGESLAPVLAVGAESYTCLTAKYASDQLYGGAKFHLEQSGLTPAAIEETIRRVRGA